MRGQLLRYPEPGWAQTAFEAVFPGAHVLCFGKTRDALEAEGAGFEVRDAIEVVGPARHRVWLLRRPVEAQNTVEQVLKTGTGAIWIDGCRVEYEAGGNTSSNPLERRRRGSSDHHGEGFFQGAGQGFEAVVHPGGRWPSNLLLVHAPGCQRSGTRTIKTPTTNRETAASTSIFQAEKTHTVRKYVDETGVEVFDAWACAPSCPVAKLDEQSGVLKSGTLSQGTLKGQLGRSGTYGEGQGYTGDVSYAANEGGASRFFPQFTDESELEAWLLRLILGPTTEAR